MKFNQVEILNTHNGIQWTNDSNHTYLGLVHMVIIQQAWNAGVDFEDLADGYGPGVETHGDWSGIRDSSHEAIQKMLERSLNRMTFKKEEPKNEEELSPTGMEMVKR